MPREHSDSLVSRGAITTRWLCFEWVIPTTGSLYTRGLNYLLLVLCIDIICSLFLFLVTNKFNFSRFSSDLAEFHHGASDVLLLVFFRILTLYIFASLAVNRGVPRELWPNQTIPSMIPFYDAWNRRKSRNAKPYLSNSVVASGSDLASLDMSRLGATAPATVPNESRFLQHSAENAVGSQNSSSSSLDGAEANEIDAKAVDKMDKLEDESNQSLLDRNDGEPVRFESKQEQEDYERRKYKSGIKKNVILMVLFLIFTFFQGYVGVKCVTFEFSSQDVGVEVLQGIFFAIIVVSINLEIFLAKIIVDKASDLGDGIMLPKLHAHPLYLEKKLKFWCNLCRTRIKFKGYRCPDCNFDVCWACFKKHKKELKGGKTASKVKKGVEDMSQGGKFKFNIYDGSTKMKKEEELSNRQYMMRAAKLCKPHAKTLILAFVCLAINSGSNLLLPSSQGAILDEIVDLDRSGFYYQVTIYVILSGVTGLFGAVRNLCFTIVGRKISVSMRSLLFRSLIVQDIAFFDGMSTGELTSRMTNDVNGMVSPLRTMLQSALTNCISLVGGLIACFVTSWRLSMLAFTTVAPVVFLTGQYAKWSRQLNRQIWAAYGTANAVAVQAFSNIRTVRSFGMEYKEMRHFDEQLKEVLQKGILDGIASTCTFFVTNYLDLGAGVLILWFGGKTIFNIESGKLDNSDLTVGKLITFQLYWNMINNAYKGLQNIITSFTRAGGAAQRVLSLLDNLPDIDLNSGRQCKVLDGHIELKNVHFSYPMRPDQPVLRGVSLAIKPGQVVALVGKSGGGKSTLIHLLMRFYDPSEGMILYNKEGNERFDLKEVNLTQFRRQIGIVSQETQLFDFTIEENITYGLDAVDENSEKEEYSKEELYHISKLANCHEFIVGFEDGYQTRVGERGVRLSGGQKQRIAIARMLMRKPSILLLDEATSNLDTESEALVQAAIDKSIWDTKKRQDEAREAREARQVDAINEEEKGNGVHAAAVILVAHRLSTVINADKIAVIDKGTVVELGSHKELLGIENGVYKRLVSRQIQREANRLKQDKTDDTHEIDEMDEMEQKMNANGNERESGGPKGSRGSRGSKGSRRGRGGGRGGKGRSAPKSTAIDSIDSLFDDFEKEDSQPKKSQKDDNSVENEK